jgi:class 3 adenylate cyclase
MPFPRAIPALADLTQDIAGPVPVGLLQDWGSGRADPASARTLLQPFETTGTVVASDTSGLTKLTREMDLLDVLRLISRPKEIIHAVGVAIGGRGVGRWVADNTQMYYPAPVGVGVVLDAMSEAQCRISGVSRVGIGMCVHPGLFYQIGGTLYGHDAQTVEVLAEHHAGPGEILLTGQGVAALPDASPYPLRAREDLAAYHATGVFALAARRRLPDLAAMDPRYPHPFTDEFFESLLGLDMAPDPSAVKRRLYAAYQRERVIALVVREPSDPAGDDLTAMLDDLVTNTCLDAIVRETVGSGDPIVTSGGGLAVLAFGTVGEALEVSRALRARSGDNAIPVRIGIDRGPVLLFENPDGSRNVAGDPVNVASKLSEDAGRAGRISVTSRAAAELSPAPAGEPFQVTVSSVLLSGLSL